MRLIDADVLKQDLTRFYDNEVTAKQLIDEQPTVGGWVSVKDRLPEIRRAVLIYTPKHKNCWAVTLHEDGKWFYWVPSSMEYDPVWYGEITHWMPLPEPPKEEHNETD